MVFPPLALVLSIIGMVRGRNRGMALAGILVSAGCIAVFFGFPLLMALCR